MSDVSRDQERIEWRKSTILFAFMIARGISYAGCFVYMFLAGPRNETLVGIWLLATCLSQFLAKAIVRRIYGPPSPAGDDRFRYQEIAEAVIVLVLVVGTITGLW